MAPAIKREALSAKFWKVFDDLDDSGILEETGEERREYDESVRNEIDWKIQPVFKSEGPTTVVHVTETLMDDDPFIEHDTCSIPLPPRVASINVARTAHAFPFAESQPPPSFHPSLMGKTSTPRAHRLLRQESIESVSDEVCQPDEELPLKPKNETRMGSELSRHSVFTESPVPLASCITSIPVATSSATHLPSFRQSQFGGVSTPHTANVTFPNIPTPSFDEATPAGPSARPIAIKNSKHPPMTASPRRRAHTIDTPEYIPSPVDTPDTSRPAVGTFGRSPRDCIATPGPLGLLPLKREANKKFQNLSKHFQAFVAKKDCGSVGGKNAAKRKVKQPVEKISGHSLGDGVFRGLRICLPPGEKPMSIQRQAWDQIIELGGTVVLYPDKATTHVIYDSHNRTKAKLAKLLRLQSLDELPLGTECVIWEWISQSKLNGVLLPVENFRSFRVDSLFSRAMSAGSLDQRNPRLAGTADQRLTGRTALESETESEESLPKKIRLQASVAQFYSNNPLRNAVTLSTAGPSKLRDSVPHHAVETEHTVSKGPGWKQGKEDQRDALDEMIEGVKDGILPEDEIVDDEQAAYSPSDDRGIEDDVDSAARFSKGGQEKSSKSEKGPNEWLAEKFDQLHDLYNGQVGKNPHSIRQYRNAAAAMRRTTFPITSGAQARKINGIGEALAERINEFISGVPGRAFYEDNEHARCVALFKDIYGVGRQYANELYQMGARTITDLRTGRFPLSPGQQIGLALYEDLRSLIPREECKQIFELIKLEAKTVDEKLWVEIMGSYRRGSETSGDVDILITRDDTDGKTHKGAIKKLVDKLKAKGVITHELSAPHDWNALEAKWMGVGRVGQSAIYRRIDILCVPYESWGASLIYFTGNELFNRSLRLYARKLGYNLNQRGLYRNVVRAIDGTKVLEGDRVASRTEEEIFQELGLRWRHPHHRRP
ncbi:DNA polymerase lambda subunit [Cryptococcus neoformans]|nr:DNA polymerase lambda subunit [Cryptococcus neoformans var. grubii]